MRSNVQRYIFLFLLVVLAVITAPAYAGPFESFTAVASWYESGNQYMKNGKKFNPNDPTIAAANEELPLGKRLILINPETKKLIIVTIQDRGPHVKGRTLDLSRAAAKELGYIDKGVTTLIAIPFEK